MKSAEELGLSKKSYAGLHSALAALKAGTIVHLEDPWEAEPDETNADKRIFFNMCNWKDPIYSDTDTIEVHCGSACCIGGTAEFIMGEPLFDETCDMTDEQRTALHYLFYPWDHPGYDHYSVEVEGSKITLDQAIQALTNYLKTGHSEWPDVYPGEPYEIED